MSSGSYAINTTDSSQMDYSVYYPVNHESEAVVLLVHGFLRDRGVMAGFA